MTSRISERPLDVASVLEGVSGEGDATCVFAGTVRDSNRGKEVVALRYEAHRPLGERVLRELEEEAEAEEGVRRCRIVHRVGTLGVGDPSVLVAVAARTPDAAVDAAQRTMDELKERVPMWKEERYADGTTRHLDGSPLRSGPRGGDESAPGDEEASPVAGGPEGGDRGAAEGTGRGAAANGGGDETP